MTEEHGTPRGVVVVTGAGGMGEAIARRIGGGYTIVLADFSERQLTEAATRLEALGHLVHAVRTDVSSAGDVEAFRTGWFIESLLTEVGVLLVIRTRLHAWQSRPAPALLVATILVAAGSVLLPWTAVGSWFGLVPVLVGLR